MRRPTDARPMRTGSAPNPLSSRTRTASPGIVTLAMRRTVALVIAVSDRACCEVAHAVTQFPPPAAGRPRSCGLAAARHPKPTRTTPASTPCRTAGVLAFMVAKYTDRLAVGAEIDAGLPPFDKLRVARVDEGWRGADTNARQGLMSTELRSKAAVIAALVVVSVIAMGAQTRTRRWTVSRTPWGDPDLQGVFANND